MTDDLERKLIITIGVVVCLWVVARTLMGCALEVNGERSPNSCDVCSHVVAVDAGVDAQ